MRWITRERPKIDRVACPWLISRFIDPEAEFILSRQTRSSKKLKSLLQYKEVLEAGVVVRPTISKTGATTPPEKIAPISNGQSERPSPIIKAMIALNRKAVELGVTFFDTAEVYGPFAFGSLACRLTASHHRKSHRD